MKEWGQDRDLKALIGPPPMSSAHLPLALFITHHGLSLDDVPAEHSGENRVANRGTRSDDKSDDLKYSSYICIILFPGLGRAGSALTPLLLMLFRNDALNFKVDVYFLFQLVAAWSNAGSTGECVCSNG